MKKEKRVSEGVPSGEKQQSFGDALHGVLVRTIGGDRSPGLLTLQFPTGAGKSYAVERTIATLVSTMPDGSPPVLFVTPQKKNIPDADAIVELCRAEGYEPAPRDVMRLHSIPDMLAATVNNELLATIPREHKYRTNVEELFDIVRCLKGNKGYGDAVRRILPKFKHSVKSLLPSDGWEERLSLLENDDEWRWLAKLWPSVFTRRAKVLLMTSSKFFCPHDTLVEAPYSIDEAEWTRGSIVFMDEFDSVKKDCLDAIVSRSTKSRADLPGLVRSLWHGVDVSMLPESMLAGKDAERNLGRIGELRRMLEETALKTHVDYVYKAEEGAMETTGLFMYDGTRRGTSIGAPYFVRTDDSRRENVIMRKSSGDGSRRLAADVSRLRGAVSYAQQVIASMLRDRHGFSLGGMDEEAVRNEILSTLEALGVKDHNEQQLMLNGVIEVLRGGGDNRGSFREGWTLYEQGFGLIAVEDSEAHRFSTHIYAYAMDETPEKRLRTLIEKALVIGLSATSLVDSPLCNYDLDWLAGQRPALMRSLDDEDLRLLRNAFERHIEGYGNVDLRVVRIATSEAGNDGLYREAMSLVKKPTLCDKIANILARYCRDVDGNPNQYPALRYVRVAKAYRYFLENVPEGVFVCATSPAPNREQDACSEYSVETLETLFRLIRRDLGAEDGEGSARFIEGSDDFQAKYDAMVGELGKCCPRMFICASYQSLATGVNLQYDGKGMMTVSVSELSFDSRVDLVGVYLDRITNIAPTSFRISDDTRAEDTLRCAYELREMAWHGDISIAEMDGAVRALMVEHSAKGVKLVNKPSVRAACTRMVVQMVGRMCRTANKAPSVHVLFDANLVERINPYAMGDDLVGVETRLLLSEVASLSCREQKPAGIKERSIAAQAFTTAGKLASLAQRRTWSRTDMRRWEAMRLWCLGHPCPTPDELVDSEMGWLYVALGQPIESYRYCEQGDFEEVDVSFDMSDAENYPLEVSDRAARLDVLARVPEVRELFVREGWPLKWEASGIAMNPAFFRNVYVGAIGEQVGKTILERHIHGLALDPIEDPKKFEKFDFVLSGTDVYVDFKHWRSPDSSGGRYVDWIREKMQRIGATHALIANLVCSDELRDKRCEEIQGNILSVPYLIDDKDACIVNEHVSYIQRWIRKAGALE